MSITRQSWCATLAQAVVRGARLLDIERPTWRDEVAPGNLQTCSPWFCVLGQTFSSYLTGLTALKIDDGSKFGFATLEEEYPLMDLLWIACIKLGTDAFSQTYTTP